LSAANQPYNQPSFPKSKAIATQLQENGFDVKPFFANCAREGQERLRFVYSYNSPEETEVYGLLSTFVFK
jgi:8-amino-7-oxononanoate synthase